MVSIEENRKRDIRRLLDNISAEGNQAGAEPSDSRFQSATASTSRSNDGYGVVVAAGAKSHDSQREDEDVAMDDVPSMSELIQFEKAEDEYPIPECFDAPNGNSPQLV